MELSLDANTLEIRLSPLERLGAVRLGSTIRIPLAQIRRAAVEWPARGLGSLRLPGLHVPGLIKAGTYYSRQEGRMRREFWFVTGARRAPLILALEGHCYDLVALSVEGAGQWAERIVQALSPVAGEPSGGPRNAGTAPNPQGSSQSARGVPARQEAGEPA
ncbi:MAG: hypothetical protein HY901_22445 [Deltaproteobacteria bacterium]|nr:hypothetical protein [Deltaproteobacteria bacterium]